MGHEPGCVGMPDGEPGGRLAFGLLCPGQRLSARCPSPVAQSLGPSWCPGLLHGAVNSSAQKGPLALTSIGFDDGKGRGCPVSMTDGEPEGRLTSGPMDPGKHPSARCSAPGSLKLRPFLVPWSPALTCVNSSAKGWPPGINQHRW
ncbi:PREDICTED: uncharacterized protein LOC108535959 [Rhinopithecus bieti]|uniref:uncharacterized protein LOC108535959 n=1 Tax=Rhinopithecus bieti TaxID=61621 RepID=UPI00083C0CD0|nr:PREDICTED: uncharacterized protein LOC108535959 [Rhinopithecus bieti]XP_017737890.1 PREDICTED: uncharacterized protein LOC108535959 [Rhinopithecus bieti]